MASTNVACARDSAQVRTLLDSPEISAFIAHLNETRWTGRPGYPIRSMVGLALVKALHTLPTWTRTVALVRDHAALRDVLGSVPSVDACYRFSAKLSKHDGMLNECIESVLSALHGAGSYWAYENWVAYGHRATIHRGDCGSCNNGAGVHGGGSRHTGRWLGPFLSSDEASAEAERVGADVRNCSRCMS